MNALRSRSQFQVRMPLSVPPAPHLNMPAKLEVHGYRGSPCSAVFADDLHPVRLVQIRELEWKHDMEMMAPEEKRKRSEGQVMGWREHWDSMTHAEQEQQRRKWKQEWEQHWNSLTAAQQQEQKLKWKEERQRKKAQGRKEAAKGHRNEPKRGDNGSSKHRLLLQ